MDTPTPLSHLGLNKTGWDQLLNTEDDDIDKELDVDLAAALPSHGRKGGYCLTGEGA